MKKPPHSPGGSIFFGWIAATIIFVVIKLYYPKSSENAMVLAILVVPAYIILSLLLKAISSDTSDSFITLTEKLMTCSLRKKHGLNYCGICPDGYSCAGGADLNDIKQPSAARIYK